MGNSYTGIGSRSTPEPVCQKMTTIAKLYRKHGFILRSGVAITDKNQIERLGYQFMALEITFHEEEEDD